MDSLRDDDEPLGDLPILINDLKEFKFEDNIEAAADAILFYINSDQGKQELDYYRHAENGERQIIRQFNSLLCDILTQLILNEDYQTFEQFLQLESFNEDEDKASILINFGAYYTLIGEDLDASDCFDQLGRSLNQKTESLEKKGWNKLRKLNTFEESDENIRNMMTMAILHNNKAVVEIKKGEHESAFKTCK